MCYWKRLPGEVLECSEFIPCSEFFKAQLAKAWCDTVLTTALTWRRDGTSWSPEVPANQNSYGSVTASCNPVYTFIKFFAPGGLWSDSVFEEEGIFFVTAAVSAEPCLCHTEWRVLIYMCLTEGNTLLATVTVILADTLPVDNFALFLSFSLASHIYYISAVKGRLGSSMWTLIFYYFCC